MSFKKPLRAVPVRYGACYAAQRRLRRRGYIALRLLAVAAVGIAIGATSSFIGGEHDQQNTLPTGSLTELADTVSYLPAHSMSAAELDAQQPASGSVAIAQQVRPMPLAIAGWSYRNCAQARAAGAAPLSAGQPGYGPHMDGDADGIACERYRPPPAAR